MPISVSCDCGALLKAPDDAAGKTVACPKCGAVVAVKAAGHAISSDPPRRRRRDFDDDPAPAPSSSKTIWIVLACVVGGLFAFVVLIGALLFPAISKVRESAARVQTMNNLKTVALAVLTFHDTNNRLPDPAEKGLSWRVSMLPFLEEVKLYNDFQMGQPWDGPRNAALVQSMPRFYGNLLREIPKNQTSFQFITGPETVFTGGRRRLPDIKDKLFETFLIVDATNAVPWSQPVDVVYDPQGPLPPIGDPTRRGRILFSSADGSVHTIDRPDDAVLRALITASGNDSVGRVLE